MSKTILLFKYSRHMDMYEKDKNTVQLKNKKDETKVENVS